MKKILLSIIFITLSFGFAVSQTPQTIKLELGSKLIGAVSVPNSLVMLTGKEYYFNPNLDWKISNYGPDLNVRYTVKLDKPVYNYLIPGDLVVSPTGNNVYFMQSRGGIFGGGNSRNITHIDSFGSFKKFIIKKQFRYDRVNVVFADDEYLYFVTKEPNKEERHRRKRTSIRNPKLQFVRVAHDETVSKVFLSLPDPETDATEWSYLGHTLEVSYFCSRKFDENNKAVYRIAVVDHDGELLDDFKMNVSVKDGEFAPGYNHSSAEGTLVVDNHNIKVTTSTYTNSSGGTTTTVTYSPNPEAFGDITFDPLTNGFFIYGLAGPKYVKSKRLFARIPKRVVNAFYLYKFDQDGAALWNYDGKLSGADDFYKSQTSFMGRDIKLNPGFGGITVFQAFSRKNVFSYELNSETGKLIKSYTNVFENPVNEVDLGSCRKPGDKSDFGRFMAKGTKGNFSQLNFRLASTNVVVRNYFSDYRLELYRFGDD